jgi:ABC-2 type transport system ATP-binding protein
MLARFQIAADKKVRELSRGMRVKLQLAFALSQGAELLILDEPTSGLDPVVREEVCELLLEFVADETRGVLFSTHITTDLEKVADFITLVQDGVSVYSGPKDDLLEGYARIAGGLDDLDGELKQLVIGYREHPTGFDALIQTTNIRRLPETIIAEPANLDEIVVAFNRGGTHE